MQISAMPPAVNPSPASLGGPAAAQRGDKRASSGAATATDSLALTPREQAEVRRLQARDREVRAHEQAHQAAGGSLVSSAASFSYTTGPDGRRYATGGEVGVDTSKGRTPEETLRRAQQIRRAALAPAQPSGQDRAVAAQASQMEAQARQELNAQQRSAAQAYGPERATGRLLDIRS